MLTLARGIGVRFYLVLQSFGQLELIYGKETEGIIKSNAMVMSLPINDYATAKELSDTFGSATIEDIIIEEDFEGKITC